MAKVILPPRGRLLPTGPVDVVNDYYRLGIGWLLRRRLAWMTEALGGKSFDIILEIGYGSGIFQYELARHAKRLIGVDVHPHAPTVETLLREDGIDTRLVIGDATRLPIAAASVDAVVMVSLLEFVDDPVASLREAERVLRPGGRLVLLRPLELRWADALWHTLSRRDPAEEFGASRSAVATAVSSLEYARRTARPRLIFRGLSPYEIVTWERHAP